MVCQVHRQVKVTININIWKVRKIRKFDLSTYQNKAAQTHTHEKIEVKTSQRPEKQLLKEKKVRVQKTARLALQWNLTCLN